MIDEEKTEEYLRCKWGCGSYDRNNKRCLYKNKCIKYQIYLDGLAEGRKEQFEQDKKCCANCMSEGEVSDLKKENARLSKILEMACDTLGDFLVYKDPYSVMLDWGITLEDKRTIRSVLEKRVEEVK